jgi:hypothetical protein
MQHREIGAIVPRGYAPTTDRSQCVFELAAIGDQLCEDVPNCQGGRVLCQSLLTSSDDLFDCELYLLRGLKAWPSRRLGTSASLT